MFHSCKAIEGQCLCFLMKVLTKEGHGRSNLTKIEKHFLKVLTSHFTPKILWAASDSM